MVLKDGKPWSATSTSGASLIQAAFQYLLNAIDYGLSAKGSVTLPRFGSYPIDPKTNTSDLTKNLLDPAVCERVVKELTNRGLKSEQSGPWIDLGYGPLIIIQPDGGIQGAAGPIAGFSTGADGY